MKEEMVAALDRALEQVRGGEPIPTVLSGYPRDGEELAPLLEASRALSLLSPVTMPPEQALREDRNRFLAELAHFQQQPVSRSPLMRLREWVSRPLSSSGAAIFSQQQKERRMSALLGKAIVVLALALGTMGGTVAAADASLPGSPLFGVKLSLEDLRLALADASEEDVDLYLSFVQERVRETARLVEKGEAPDDAVLSRLRVHLESALQLAGEMPEDARLRQMLRIREAVRDQEQEMVRLQEHAARSHQQHLQEARRYLRRIGQEIEAGLQEAQNFRWQNMEDRPGEVPEPQEAGPRSGGQNEEPGPMVPRQGNGPGPGGPAEQPDDPVCRHNECQPDGDQNQEQYQEQNQEQHQYGGEGQQHGPGSNPDSGNNYGSGNDDGQQGPGPGQDDGGGMGPGPGDGGSRSANDDGGNGGNHGDGGSGGDGSGGNDGGGGGSKGGG